MKEEMMHGIDEKAAEVAAAVEAVESVEAEEVVEAEESVETAAVVETAESAEVEKGVETVESIEMAEAAESVEPVESAESVQAVKRAESTATIQTVPIEAVWQSAQAAVKAEEPYPEQPGDRRMAALMFVLAYLAVDILGAFRAIASYGAGVTLFTVIYGVSMLIYARQKAIKVNREGWFWLAVLMITGVSYTFIDHHTLGWFGSLFLRFLLVYFPFALFGAGVNGQTSAYFVLDSINAMVLIPLNNLRAQWKFTGRGMQQVKIAGTVIKAVLGLIVSIPLFLVVASLLSSADSAFADLLSDFGRNIGGDIFEIVWKLLLSLPVGCYLFAGIYGAANKRGTAMVDKEGVISTCKVFALAPAVSVYAALTGICLLYVMFIFLQGSYYISAIRGILPEGFTYSEYARQGFFELVQVSMINIGILLAAELFSKTKGLMLKVYRFVVSLLTVFLIITAMTKMMLYIQAYGLTQLRVISSAFMIFLAAVFLLIMVSQFKALPVMRLTVCIFALGFSVMMMANMDGQIARYNLVRYQSGTLDDLPEQTLYRCGAAAVPAIYEVWEDEQDPDRKEKWQDIIVRIGHQYEYSYIEKTVIKKWNLTRHQASSYTDSIFLSMQ